MAIRTVTDAIRYVGVDDNTLALFENQYPVQPMGVSYNSYVILDEKIAVMDSVDARAAEEWLSNVAQVLEGRSPDYLVVTHMEPDHSGSLMRLAQKYPEMKIVGNAKTFTLIKQFFGTGALSEDRMLEVGERDTLSLGLHRLRFLLAPMVHWPEVMAAYEEEEKILFSADAFGRFGSLERTARAPWAPQARRYYYNIVGKYGAQVQALLKKISALEIKTICPLHGPMLTEDLGEYLRLYDLWSQWKPEEPEGILIAHASIHGNTAYASEALKSKLEGKGAQVTMCDLTATDLSYAVTSAFYCGKLVLACSTYDGGLFPPMKEFLEHLQTKGFRNRRIGLMENGSWAPAAARLMRAGAACVSSCPMRSLIQVSPRAKRQESRKTRRSIRTGSSAAPKGGMTLCQRARRATSSMRNFASSAVGGNAGSMSPLQRSPRSGWRITPAHSPSAAAR